jgi:hypothetical protein
MNCSNFLVEEMADLTRQWGLNRSIINAAFGDKRALFSLALKRYMDSRAGSRDWSLGLRRLW